MSSGIAEIAQATATRLAAKLKSRELSALEVVDACLQRIDERDADIRAWTVIDVEYARSQARALDSGPIRGPLHGVPIAVKDIIATAALPTQYGSSIYAGYQPDHDAACVSAALSAGAIVLGKTATTEFAFLSPTSTVNPLNQAHTPGGSSSGSAAAVADSMVPLAFGTQTAGSVIRPASYCGIVGYKPTYGTIDRAGIKLIAESLDTVGVLARSVSDAALFTRAITGNRSLLQPLTASNDLQIGFCRTHDWNEVDSATASIIESAVDRLTGGGARLSTVQLPAEFAQLQWAHTVIQGFEAARNLEFELDTNRLSLSPTLLAMLDNGAAVSKAQYDENSQLVEACRESLAEVFGSCHVLVTASATGEAPTGLGSTGNPVMNRIWTALHTPCISVPAATGPNGLPVGLQIIGRPGDDARALACADWIDRHIRIS
ncbi:MAG: amidase [Gammaproteobacteria bacterium]|jgi:Asp-tRNA(Asn)/Glu-tRNA(Gln) amidotransferase A subunit family amidase